jgi:hypothetical protein
VPSILIQQLLNVLQATNLQAVKVDQNNGPIRPLLTSLFLANGATSDGNPLPFPTDVDFADYLVWYQAPGGESALLTRAQIEVIMESSTPNEGDRNPLTTKTFGCCMGPGGPQPSMLQSACEIPPNEGWSQGACPSKNG